MEQIIVAFIIGFIISFFYKSIIKLLSKIKIKTTIEKLTSNFLPKIVICFNQSGCMANILEFEWIGYVTKEVKEVGNHGMIYKDNKIYEIQPLIKFSNKNRNTPLEKEKAWQLQHLGLNLYIHYK